jgi:hypothetical protein
MVWVVPGSIVWTGSRSWYYPRAADYVAREMVRAVGSQWLPPRFQRNAWEARQLQWRLQEVRNARNMGCLLRKATCSERSQLQRVAMWATADNSFELEIPKSFKVDVTLPCVPDGGGRGIEFDVCPVGFQPCFDMILLFYAPISPF